MTAEVLKGQPVIIGMPVGQTGTPGHTCCTAAEPTEAEFSAAKAEALQGLQFAIDNINEMLEEVKYAEADLDEQ